MEHRFPWRWSLADLPEPEQDAPTVFSCFSCGGGSSMGYKRAGFRVLGCCEIDPEIFRVYDANLRPEMGYVMDVREFAALAHYPEALRGLDVLDGSPPCSTFSMAGDREKAWGVEKRFAEGQKKQRLDDLFFAFLDVAERLRPKVVVAENVEGIVMGKARGYVSEIAARMKGLGYAPQLFVLDASRMGVPQERRRAFFVANRMGWPPLRMEFDERPVTFGECKTERVGGRLTDRTAALVSALSPGETSLKKACMRLEGKAKRFNETVCWDWLVPKTLTASAVPTRMPEGARVSERDVLNMATFPQDYEAPKGRAQFLAGMSVPPSMMANVAAAMRDQWPL